MKRVRAIRPAAGRGPRRGAARALLLALLAFGPAAHAEGLQSGVYVGTYQSAAMKVELRLLEDEVVGRLDDGAGALLLLAGQLREGRILGEVSLQERVGFFHARMEAGTLAFVFVPLGTDGAPDYDAARRYSFVRVAASGETAPAGAEAGGGALLNAPLDPGPSSR